MARPSCDTYQTSSLVRVTTTRSTLVAVLHGLVGGRTEPTPSLCLSDADGLRASKLKHAVQGMNCNGDLSSATALGPRTQRIADHAFKAADSGLYEGTTSVPGPFLPAHASMLGDA